MDQAETLRARIRASEQLPVRPIQSEARVFTVTSGKGGVGKTSLSVNLALQFQRMGKRAIIVDADFGLANIEVMLGIHPQYNISDLIYKDKNIEDVVIRGPEGIGFISGGSGVNELINLDRTDLRTFVSKLSRLDKLADVLIIDTGAGISDSVQEFVLSSPEVLLVLTPEPTSTMDAYALLKAINRRKEFVANDKKIHVISNRVSNEREGQTLFRNISIVASQFLNIDLNYLGSIPQDASATKAVLMQQPITMSFPNSTASRSIRHISQVLLDTEMDNRGGFVGMFLNMLETGRRKTK
jgi:flagellar biosynthesis protein FlhG